jgi:hypothetical protein
MKIESYSFGHMTIDGKKYKSDLIIYPEGEIEDEWRRIEGHELVPEDLVDIAIIKPDVFIMGTGYSGILKIPPETKKFFEDNEIELQETKTKEATEIFNELIKNKEKRIMAGFHLTC